MVQTERNQEKVVVTKNAFMVRQNKKWKLVLLKYSLMVQTKSKLEKDITTKILL